MFRRLLATSPTWATIPLRLALAPIFIGHGAQKVLGSFGGRGLEAFTAGEAPFAFMRPSWLWLGAAAFSELVGGVLLILGLFTRVASFFLVCTMLTAVAVHWPNFFASNRGFEFPLALLAMCISLLIVGGGAASVDGAIAGSRKR